MKLGDFLKALFSRAVRLFKALLKAAIPLAKQIIIGQLSAIAENAVRELSSTDLTNSEKRNEAFNRIKEYATGKGIDARDSLINMVIELALQKIKEEL